LRHLWPAPIRKVWGGLLRPSPSLRRHCS
jgi:hypothetical protein